MASHFERSLPANVVEDIGTVGGVWEGRYRVVDARTLELKREYRSRQTSRRIGDIWEEKIEYLHEDRPPETKIFTAKMTENGGHIYDLDQEVSGRSEKSSQGQVLFPYVWSAQHDSGRETLEVQHYISETRRTRVWQRFVDGRLDEIVLIEEEKLSRQGD